MFIQTSLFDIGGYPTNAAYRKTDTSKAAAEKVDAAKGRELVRRQLDLCPLTADEVAEQLGLSILYIRPRVSEMKKLGQITDSGARRKNESGRAAIVWRINA